MKHEIKVPSMGESITEASVAEILKASGSTVGVDDEVLELETDKVNQVLYAPAAGVVTLTVNVDDVVGIGDVIGHVDAAKGAKVSAKADPKAAETKAAKEESTPATASKAEPASDKTEKAPAPEPAHTVTTGFSARLTQDAFIKDVLDGPKATEHVSGPTPEAKALQAPTGERTERRVKMSKIRKVIAKRLVEAQQTTAMLTTFNEVDLTEVMAMRSRYKDAFLDKHGAKLGFMSFFIKATVAALQAIPGLNAYIDGEELVYREYYDIGIAVGTDRGLVVPVLRGCDQLSFAEVEQGIVEYAKKARSGGLTVDDLMGGGFTITNGGVYGSLLSTPILNPPQSGILGMHKIDKRAVVVNDEIVIRPMMYLALSYDHRVVDGKEAVTFLVHIKNSLEDPSRLLLHV